MSKKHLVLIALFILPVVVYLFFASGINNFSHLPVVANNTIEVNGFKNLKGEPVKITEKITVLGFLGNDLTTRKVNVYNLHEEIYKDNHDYDKNFQMLMLLPEGSQSSIEEVIVELSRYTDVEKWQFAFGAPDAINAVFKSLQSPYSLEANFGTDYVFIIDKERNVRCRVDDEDLGKMHGYNATSIAELHKKMDDDVKVVLAEYNLALKKNYKVSRRDSFLKINQKKKKNEE